MTTDNSPLTTDSVSGGDRVEKKSGRVKEMFASIAHRYDFLNRLLSLSMDRRWRRVATEVLLDSLPRRNALVLDLCTGTADLALELSRRCGRVVGCDFCHPMLILGRGKVASSGTPERVSLVEGDALGLPFPADRFDGVTIAFGLRNLEDCAGGLAEMHRVLRPGGVLEILEFSQPKVPVFRQLYSFYFRRVLPSVGGCFSGERAAYAYLPESVRQFPSPDELLNLMESAGFSGTCYRRLSGGIVCLHLGRKL